MPEKSENRASMSAEEIASEAESKIDETIRKGGYEQDATYRIIHEAITAALAAKDAEPDEFHREILPELVSQHEDDLRYIADVNRENLALRAREQQMRDVINQYFGVEEAGGDAEHSLSKISKLLASPAAQQQPAPELWSVEEVAGGEVLKDSSGEILANCIHDTLHDQFIRIRDAHNNAAPSPAQKKPVEAIAKELNGCRNRMANAFNQYGIAKGTKHEEAAAELFWKADDDYNAVYSRLLSALATASAPPAAAQETSEKEIKPNGK